MVREKPRLNRRRVLAEEADRRRDERIVRGVLGELSWDEFPGTPYRLGRTIVVPVLKRNDAIEFDEPVGLEEEALT